MSDQEWAEEWDVRRFFETLKASGLDGLSHEDGWTLMTTETANGLKAKLQASERALERANEALKAYDFRFTATYREKRMCPACYFPLDPVLNAKGIHYDDCPIGRHKDTLRAALASPAGSPQE